MNWIKLISGIKDPSISHSFNQPALIGQIEEAEIFFGHELPKDLKELYSQTNGIKEVGWGELVFSVENLISFNKNYRTNPDFSDIFMPFDNLLFFGNIGNGDYFAYPITKDKTCRDEIFVWNHETDERIYVITGLEKLLKGWITSEISV
jgi:SMI1-KNR4 cell-wall